MLNKSKNFLKSLIKTGSNDMNQNSVDEDANTGIPRVYTEPYFFGRITRQEAEEILDAFSKENGTYLLRESITPMGNFSLSIQFDGIKNHYSIEKQIDGTYVIPQGKKFRDPLELIEFYKQQKVGLVTSPTLPCVRGPGQDAIAFRGLSYPDLHENMKNAARNMNASLSRALGPMREALILTVLRHMHAQMPWFHGEVTREEAMNRMQESGHEDGKFLVRSKPDSSCVLTLSHENQFRHYVIAVGDEHYSMEKGPNFKTLIMLIDHYHNKRDGLPCKLIIPVCKPECPHKTWETYKKNSVKIWSLVKPHSSGQAPVASSPPRRSLPKVPDAPQHIPSSSSFTSLASQSSQDFHESDDEIPDTAPPIPIRTVSAQEAEELEQIYEDVRDQVMARDLHPDQIHLEDDNLGSGQFGDVMRGTCDLQGRPVPVAVKKLKNSDPVAENEILSEARLMKELDHPHIVRMFGMCKGNDLMLVMELVEVGPLKKYLRDHKDMSLWHQVELILQICEGMIYLSSKGIVHRDLATRNVLLMTDHFAKISDFGLSRMVNDYSEYYTSNTPGRWPLRWYAPECINYHKFDCKSDVWSFGVTMWEILTFGCIPYGKRRTPKDIMDFIENGHRLAQPPKCDAEFYKVLLDCWILNKKERPSFEDLRPRLETFLDLYRNTSGLAPQAPTRKSRGAHR